MRAFALIPLLSLAAACSGPDVYRPDVIALNGEDFDYGEGVIENVVAEVRSNVHDIDIEVEEVSGRLSDGRLAVQFGMRNEDDIPARLHVTWVWRDAGGVVLRRGRYETPEQYLVLRPGEYRVLPFTSPTDEAIQCVIDVNYTAKPE